LSFSASDYIIGILAIVLFVFTASDYIIGILAIVLLVFTASDYIIGILTNKTMAKIPMM
jgi:hypothetical protein